jgi:anti-anti-sigma factor
MQVEPVDVQGTAVLRVSGRLDAGQAAAFGARLLALLADANATSVLDLAAVEYVSSGGLRVLLQAAKLLQSRGLRLTLTQVPAQVYSVLILSGFATFMVIRPQA